MTSRGLLGPVINRRMIQVPPGLRQTSPQGIEPALSRTARGIEERIEELATGDTIDALRRFYVAERMSNWAFIGLNANRYEYDLVLPLLSRQYLAWSNGISPSGRRGRHAQGELLTFLAERSPMLRPLTEMKTAEASAGIGNVVRLAKKLLARAFLGHDPRAELGGPNLIQLVEAEEGILEAIADLEQLEVFGRSWRWSDLRSLSSTCGGLVGMFLTAAVVLRAGTYDWKIARQGGS